MISPNVGGDWAYADHLFITLAAAAFGRDIVIVSTRPPPAAEVFYRYAELDTLVLTTALVIDFFAVAAAVHPGEGRRGHCSPSGLQPHPPVLHRGGHHLDLLPHRPLQQPRAGGGQQVPEAPAGGGCPAPPAAPRCHTSQLPRAARLQRLQQHPGYQQSSLGAQLPPDAVNWV